MIAAGKSLKALSQEASLKQAMKLALQMVMAQPYP